MRSFLLPAAAVAIALCGRAEAEEGADYLRDIKPVLKERCYSCHGALKQKSRLRLDTGEAVRRGARGEPIVSPENPDGSELLLRVLSKDPDEQMPPEGPRLAPDEIERMREWIASGAPSPEEEKPEADPREHWAFLPPVRPATPAPADLQARVRNSIDAFIFSAHEAQGLTPAAEASKETLLRRVHLDLTGLPPSREELIRFCADENPGAYERVVDQLLASPQHAQRWARHWMDVWRYADWYGRRHVPDVWNSAPQVWRWRDWIETSLQADKGYDRMLTEMLAADEVAPADKEARVATGYLVRNWYALNPNQWMRDIVEHTGKAFLGLTFNCAHCHDHKYDPITLRDYFAFRAFFEPLQVRQDAVDGEPDPGPFQLYKYSETRKVVMEGMVSVFDERLDATTAIYLGGDERNVTAEKSVVEPAMPAFLKGDSLAIHRIDLPEVAFQRRGAAPDQGKPDPVHYPPQSTGRRRALAAWLTNRTNPLTARVAVNHIWARHFHAPLVSPVFDFGRSGAPPAHPELLDWLAVELMENGWSMKHLHRLIVTSSAYRMMSSGDPANRERDPDNRLLWRMNIGQMEAEAVRDSILHAAGELDLTSGGKPLPNSEAEKSRRRSLYFECFPEPGGHSEFAEQFDPPSPVECYRRASNIRPQQALALINSALAAELSGILAQRICADTNEEFIGAAFEQVLTRAPRAAELDACGEFMRQQDAAGASGASRAAIVHALFNHHDFITIR